MEFYALQARPNAPVLQGLPDASLPSSVPATIQTYDRPHPVNRVAHGYGTGQRSPTRTRTRKTRTCGFWATPQVPVNPYRYFTIFPFRHRFFLFSYFCFLFFVMFRLLDCILPI